MLATGDGSQCEVHAPNYEAKESCVTGWREWSVLDLYIILPPSLKNYYKSKWLTSPLDTESMLQDRTILDSPLMHEPLCRSLPRDLCTGAAAFSRPLYVSWPTQVKTENKQLYEITDTKGYRLVSTEFHNEISLPLHLLYQISFNIHQPNENTTIVSQECLSLYSKMSTHRNHGFFTISI